MSNHKKPVVLIVDDNKQNLQYLSAMCENCGYDVAIATDGNQVMEFVKNDTPDIILLDIIMPIMDGIKICKNLKRNKLTKSIPIIFITAKNDSQDIIDGFEAGGVDYVTKPFNSHELISRIKTHIDLKLSRDELKEKNIQLTKKNEEIIKMYTKLKLMMETVEQMSITDYLTNLYNRRYIIDRITKEIARFKRLKKDFCLIVCDVDNFKFINDTYGHDHGDKVLQSIAFVLNDSIREVDMVARWGGEEFMLLLPETSIDGANILAERLRLSIQSNKVVVNDTTLSVTITLGICSYNGRDQMDEFVCKADTAMYQGKKSGRNCVITYTEK